MLNRLICIFLKGHKFDFTKNTEYIEKADGYVIDRGTLGFCLRCNTFTRLY